MPFKVKMTCVEVNGRCVQGHKVGDEIVFDGPKVIGKLCPDVLNAVYPKIYAMRYGARFPWGKVFRFPCPDIANMVIFKIEPVGLTTEPFYHEAQMKLLGLINRNPGTKIEELLGRFTEQERKNYWLSVDKIRVFVDELREVKQVEVRDDKVYPTSQGDE